MGVQGLEKFVISLSTKCLICLIHFCYSLHDQSLIFLLPGQDVRAIARQLPAQDVVAITLQLDVLDNSTIDYDRNAMSNVNISSPNHIS